MPAKFILVRHAEGTHNLAAETEGDAAYANEANRDARLTGKGALQAQDAGKKIAENWPNVTAVWCSPLTRCIQTAKHIMKSVKVPSNSIFVHDYLIERQRKKDICNFRAEAKDIHEEWPEFSTEFIPDVASHWSEDEPQNVVKQRVNMLLEHLKRKYTSGTVIIVSHFETLYEIVGRGLNNAEFVVWEQS